MADKEDKKKGGKMPIIAAVAVLLAGGGYFMMSGKKEAPRVEEKLGQQVQIGELLTNLKGGGYATVDAWIQLKDSDYVLHEEFHGNEEEMEHYNHLVGAGGDGGHGKKKSEPLQIPRHAVGNVLSQWSVADLEGDIGHLVLKRALAASVNDEISVQLGGHGDEESHSEEEDHGTCGPGVYTYECYSDVHPEKGDWDADGPYVVKIILSQFVWQES
jgi:hypothetical protein